MVTLVVAEADPQKARERIGRARLIHPHLKSSKTWPKACLPKLKATIIQLQKERAKIEVNDDTLSAYFHGENAGDEYFRVRKAFEDLHKDPHFEETRIGEAEALQKSYYSNHDVAMQALENALRPTPVSEA